MKAFLIASTVIAAFATPVISCPTFDVAAPDGYAIVRGADLYGPDLWKLNNGSLVDFCSGRSSYDGRGIEWLWIEFKTRQEPWLHKGWISSRVISHHNDLEDAE